MPPNWTRDKALQTIILRELCVTFTLEGDLNMTLHVREGSLVTTHTFHMIGGREIEK